MIHKIKSRLNFNIMLEGLVGLLLGYFCWSSNMMIDDAKGDIEKNSIRIAEVEKDSAGAKMEQIAIRIWLTRVEDKLDRVIEKR